MNFAGRWLDMQIRNWLRMIVCDGSIEHAIYDAVESDAWTNIEGAIANDDCSRTTKGVETMEIF